MLSGVALTVCGVYILFGLGWALISGAAPLLFLAFVLIRGVARVA